MPKPFTIYCLSTVVSPLTHMAGSEGNRAVLLRHPVYDPSSGVVREVPGISGNALRSVALRRPGMDWLIASTGLHERLVRPEAYFLLSGGAEYEGGGRESMHLIAALADACPLAGVLGGVTPNQIFSGSVLCDQGVLVCRENAPRLATFLPPGVGVPPGLRPASEFVGEYQLYRHDHAAGVAGRFDGETDARERALGEGDTLKGERKDGKAGGMPFGGECVIPGAVFAHRFTLVHPSPLEVGAVLFSLRLWAERGNRVGGMSARGHGLFGVQAWHEPGRFDGADEEYRKHVLGKPDALAKWLADAFRTKLDGEKKPAKKKAVKA